MFGCATSALFILELLSALTSSDLIIESEVNFSNLYKNTRTLYFLTVWLDLGWLLIKIAFNYLLPLFRASWTNLSFFKMTCKEGVITLLGKSIALPRKFEPICVFYNWMTSRSTLVADFRKYLVIASHFGQIV